MAIVLFAPGLAMATPGNIAVPDSIAAFGNVAALLQCASDMFITIKEDSIQTIFTDNKKETSAWKTYNLAFIREEKPYSVFASENVSMALKLLPGNSTQVIVTVNNKPKTLICEMIRPDPKGK